MFTFTPILGAQSDSHASQSILELDGDVKILVDVGWDEKFDTRKLAELEKHTSTLSFILLTHATISHLGAFAHCCKNIPNFSHIPVYATSPVIAFGRTLLQDLYASAPLAATFIPRGASDENESTIDERPKTHILRQPPTFEEINKYFSLITPLKYSQPLQPTASQLSPAFEGLTLTAYNSGHTLGGTIWHIQYGMESIVYAVDWNQARENVIAGAAWFGGIGGSEVIEQLRKPTALVCSSVGGDKAGLSGGRKARDEALLGHIRSCVSKGGSVLIPTDSSARILELAWILEKAWQESDEPLFKDVKVYVASKSANATLRHARSLLEWMDDSIVREFEGEDENATKTHKRTSSKQANNSTKASRPFELRHVKVIERDAQLERALRGDGPKVILASDTSLQWGYSRLVLEHIAQQTTNLVILTERTPLRQASPETNQVLWRWYEEREHGVAVDKTSSGMQLEQIHGGGRKLSLQIVAQAPLDEAESKQYQQYIATQQQMQESLVMNSERTAEAADDNIEDDSSSSSSEESDDEQQGRALNFSSALGHANRNKAALTDEDLGVSILIRKQGVYDFDVRNKKGRNAVFPYTHSRRRGDDFGDLIKPEDFLRDEEKEEQETRTNDKSSGTIGEKRKWDHINKSKHESSNKRQQLMQGMKASQNAEVEDAESDSSASSSDEEVDELQGSRGPAKAVFSKKVLELNARLAFVDFAGLHDQRSLQLMIPLIGPRKLIFTGGSTPETTALASDCKELLNIRTIGAEHESSTEIFTPSDGQTVDASVDTNAWVVKLTRNLAKNLHWQNVKNMGIVTLQAQLKGESINKSDTGPESQAKKPKLDTDSKPETLLSGGEVDPILDIIPSALAASTRTVAQPIHVGDMRLAELRRIMNASGHIAEFRGEGTLLVDGTIAIKKLSTGKIIVEGVPVSTMTTMTARTSDSFTHVRRMIYNGLAVVAAG